MSGHQCNLVDVVKIGVVNQLVCLLHSIWWLIYSRENFESNNISILWKLYSMFRLKALEMTIPMVCHTYIYHEWKRTFWGKNGPKTDHFWRKVRFADFRRQNGPKYQLCKFNVSQIHILNLIFIPWRDLMVETVLYNSWIICKLLICSFLPFN